MPDIRSITPDAQERRDRLVHELMRLAHEIADGEIEADCFILLTVDTNYSPPLISPLEYDMSYGDYCLALREAERLLLTGAYGDD